MNKSALLLLCASLVVFTAMATPPVTENAALAKELSDMMALEQRALKKHEVLDKEEIFKANAEKLKKIIQLHGWPTIEMVGAAASQAAWLIAQHADHDKEFQLSVLRLIEPLAQQEKIAPANYAYLYDRTHQPQHYGTQGECQHGVFVPFTMAEPEQVEAKRKALKMQSLQDYIAMATRYMCQKKQ